MAALWNQKCLAPLLDGCCCCADVFAQYCRIDIFHRCLEVINGRGLDPSNLYFDPPTGKSYRGCNQGNAEAKRTPRVTKWFFLLWASSGWFTSIEQLRHLVARQWIDRWQMNCFQIMSGYINGIDDIKADLPATSTIHFITSPFPSMSQTNSCHHYAMPLSQMCLLIFGILWHPGDVISLIVGLGERDTYSYHSQEAAQGVYNCKWWEFWALFDICVDLKLVSIKLIFTLYQKSDLVSCLRSSCLCYKNQ